MTLQNQSTTYRLLKKYRDILLTPCSLMGCGGMMVNETSEKNREVLKRRLKLHFHQGDPLRHAQVPQLGRATVPGFTGNNGIQWNNEMTSRRKHPCSNICFQTKGTFLEKQKVSSLSYK